MVPLSDIVAVVNATAETALPMSQTVWALLPAVVAIILALITKEVYISLFIGIFTGAMFLAHGNPIVALQDLFNIMGQKLGPDTEIQGEEVVVTSAGNAGILIFILELGILVALMNKAGGAKAFGNWVSTHIKSRKGALLATTGLGCALFVDDYFNRLTNGTIMQPVNDKFRISRAKTAFLAGSLSIAICILVPISSWASFIASCSNDSGYGTGFSIFLQTIFCNFYPILLILFIVFTTVFGIDLFGLYKHEHRAVTTGDLTGGLEVPRGEEVQGFSAKGKVFDLVLPIAVLIASCCTLLLLKKDGEAMFETNTALPMSGCIAIVFCLFLYLPRKLMKLKEFTGCFVSGFKSIADVIIILAFAWTLTGVCQAMNIDDFVSEFAKMIGGAKVLLPALLFLIAMGISFATGTSWGTFGIMVPIVAGMGLDQSLMVLTISAVLSGSLFGDQVSPISDVTILAAAASKCNHLGYVKAQLPSALLIAGITFVTFLIAGVTSFVWVGWIVAVVLFTALILTAYFIQKKRGRLIDKLYKEALAKEENATTEINDEVAVSSEESSEN